MRESALGCGGRVVQTMGDEVLCVFPTALAATQAATEMQSRIEMQEPVSGWRLQIHIGLQFGPVLEEGPDVFGDCVNVAARMVKLAKPSQIIAGGECVEALTRPMKDQTRALGKLPVKGRGRGAGESGSGGAVAEGRGEGNDPGPGARTIKARQGELLRHRHSGPQGVSRARSD